MAPNSEATVDVLFRPVMAGSGEAKVSLSPVALDKTEMRSSPSESFGRAYRGSGSPELGDFP